MKTERKYFFEQRFRKFYPGLCRIAYGYVFDKDVCEDVVQEAFIALWEKGKDNLPEEEFYAYVARSVRNGCISFLRKNKVTPVSLDAVPPHGTDTGNEGDEDEGQKPHPEDVLKEVMQILPERCREIFLLSKLHALKYREIAQQLGISEKTVENQMGKAIRMLREYVRKHPISFLFYMLLYHLFLHKSQ